MSDIVSIANLPETDNVLSSDRIYVFSDRDSTFVKEEISLSELSSYFYAKDTIDKLGNKFTELLKLSSEFLSFLHETYPTEEYISSNYSTISSFNNTFKKVQTVTSVSSFLDDYANNLYEEYVKTNAKQKCEAIKLDFQKDSGNSIVTQMNVTV